MLARALLSQKIISRRFSHIIYALIMLMQNLITITFTAYNYEFYEV